MPRIFQIAIFINCLFALALVITVKALPADSPAAPGPIHVEADRMESDQQNESVHFAGNVEARQGEMQINAEQMTVRYHKKDSTSASYGSQENKSIESLVASGNVKVTRGDWIASGDQLQFISKERQVVLTGNTRVWQDNNMVTGERVVLYLDEGKSVVEKKEGAEEGRVKAFFYPETEKKEVDDN